MQSSADVDALVGEASVGVGDTSGVAAVVGVGEAFTVGSMGVLVAVAVGVLTCGVSVAAAVLVGGSWVGVGESGSEPVGVAELNADRVSATRVLTSGSGVPVEVVGAGVFPPHPANPIHKNVKIIGNKRRFIKHLLI